MTGFFILVFGVAREKVTKYEIALALASGADFRRLLHHVSSWTRPEGS